MTQFQGQIVRAAANNRVCGHASACGHTSPTFPPQPSQSHPNPLTQHVNMPLSVTLPGCTLEDKRFYVQQQLHFPHKSNKLISFNVILNWKRSKQKVLTYVSFALCIISIKSKKKYRPMGKAREIGLKKNRHFTLATMFNVMGVSNIWSIGCLCPKNCVIQSSLFFAWWVLRVTKLSRFSTLSTRYKSPSLLLSCTND